MTGRSLGTSLSSRYSYYAWVESGSGKLKELKTNTSAAATLPLQSLAYTYDQLGNITQVNDGRAGEQISNYRYDALNRLVYAEAINSEPYSSEYSEAYSYDDKPHAVVQAGANQYTYDANGNMSERIVDGSASTLLYDGKNRLVEVQDASGNPIARYTYDGAGEGRGRSSRPPPPPPPGTTTPP